MNTSDQMSAATAATAPLSDTMLAMDVADTLRHDADFVPPTPSPDEPRHAELIEKLRDLYRRQGFETTDAGLADGILAYAENRFAYLPPRRGFGAALARIYVGRRRWMPAVTAVTLMLVIGFGGYFLVYRPYHLSQIERAHEELATAIPAQMDAIYQTIFEETKVQQAANDAAELRARGKEAAAAGDRAGAETALAALANIRDTLRQDYRLRVVSRPGVQWGFWTFPKVNSEATNYYVVVDAADSQGNAVSLPIRSEETGQTDTVSTWGVRVPEEVYRAIEADKNDDGVVQHNLIAVKQFGFLEPDYMVQVLGGEVTRW